jgi:molybdopterin converting factor subunit 1
MPERSLITVHLFARARDLAGAPQLTLDLPRRATVATLRRRLLEQVPALSGLLERSAVAVEGEFAADSLELPAGAEVALLPPVSGG